MSTGIKIGVSSYTSNVERGGCFPARIDATASSITPFFHMPVFQFVALPLSPVCKQIWPPRTMFHVEKGYKTYDNIAPNFRSCEPSSGTLQPRCRIRLRVWQTHHKLRSWFGHQFVHKYFLAPVKSRTRCSIPYWITITSLVLRFWARMPSSSTKKIETDLFLEFTRPYVIALGWQKKSLLHLSCHLPSMLIPQSMWYPWLWCTQYW